MKKVKFNGDVLTKKKMCIHICKVFFFIAQCKFLKLTYEECRSFLRFLVTNYRPETKNNYENLNV